MDGSLLQLDRIDIDLPNLICQYTYFLNKIASKILLIGFSPDTFHPLIYISSLEQNQQLHFKKEEWCCFNACLKYCLKFLTEKSKTVWYSSNSLVIESITTNSERLIRITNFDVVDGVIELNLEEIQTIEKYSEFLTTLINHYSENWLDVETFYHTYLFKCAQLNKKKLDFDDFFKPSNRSLNYFRIFNEIPIICERKLEADFKQ